MATLSTIDFLLLKESQRKKTDLHFLRISVISIGFCTAIADHTLAGLLNMDIVFPGI